MAYLADFHHKLTGPENGPKLVFLHGLMGYWANWRGIISAFESTHRILAYDQRGHGRSIKPAHGYAPGDYAGDLNAILNDLGWESVSLVGHSMGGRAAIAFALKFPHRIKKLVIEDIGPMPEGDNPEYYAELLAKVPTPFRDKKKAKEFLYNSFDPVLGAYLYSNIDEIEPGHFDWRFSKTAILETAKEGHSHARWKDFASLAGPALLIRGENSRQLSRPTFERVLKENPRIKGVEIPNAGHWVHFDKPKEFISAVQAFLI